MQIVNAILATSLIFTSSWFSQSNKYSPGISELTAEEYAFAQTSLQKGIRTAFLTYLSDDAIIFNPDITNGKNWYSNYPASGNVLNWKPLFSDISISGDLGYTTGPWEFSKIENPDSPVAFGHYVSVWKKEADGKWKVILDTGISHEYAQSFNLKNITTEDIESPLKTIIDPDFSIENNKAALMDADIDFAKASRTEGFPKAFLTFAGDDVRLYRNEYLPITGKIEAFELLERTENISTWNPHVSGVSSAGDLGYTYGILEKIKSESDNAPVERFTYMRIWKKKPSGKWQLVLDITNPLPASDD